MLKMDCTVSKIDTTAVKFGDDWAGVYIKGQDALWYTMILKIAQEHLKDVDDMNIKMYLPQLIQILESCRE